MKYKKNVLVSLSVFIVVILVLTLFSQQGKPFTHLSRPVYDSGWIAQDIPSNTVYHNLADLGFDNVENYLVDIQGYYTSTGIQGSGGYWWGLTNSSIIVGYGSPTFRVRIWVYE